MENLKKERAERLRLLKRGQTDKQFAEKFGLPWTTARKWLTGDNSPRDEQIWQKIADTYNVPLPWLLWGHLPESEQFTDEQLSIIFSHDSELAGITEYNDRITPIVRAYTSPHQVGFFCIHCNQYHYHGVDEYNVDTGKPESSPRTSHCVSVNSPYKTNGYILLLSGDIQLQPNRTGREQRCRKCNKVYSAAFRVCSCGYSYRADSNNPFQKMSESYRNIYLINSGRHAERHEPRIIDATQQNEALFESSMYGWFENMKKWIIYEYGGDNDSAQEFVEQFKTRFPEYRNWLASRPTIKNAEESRPVADMAELAK